MDFNKLYRTNTEELKFWFFIPVMISVIYSFIAIPFILFPELSPLKKFFSDMIIYGVICTFSFIGYHHFNDKNEMIKSLCFIFWIGFSIFPPFVMFAINKNTPLAIFMVYALSIPYVVGFVLSKLHVSVGNKQKRGES